MTQPAKPLPLFRITRPESRRTLEQLSVLYGELSAIAAVVNVRSLTINGQTELVRDNVIHLKKEAVHRDFTPDDYSETTVVIANLFPDKRRKKAFWNQMYRRSYVFSVTKPSYVTTVCDWHTTPVPFADITAAYVDFCACLETALLSGHEQENTVADDLNRARQVLLGKI